MIKLSSLLEKQGDKYEYGCVMLYIDIPVKVIHNKISKNDLYQADPGDDRTYGIEDEPHITLLFGLHSDEIDDNQVIKTVQNFNYPELVLDKVSIFKNEKYDVLKFDVLDETETLSKCNEKLKQFPYTNEYPDYHPHCTIAYLKRGLGKKYVDMFNSLHFAVDPKFAVYSKPPNDKIKIQING